MVDHLSAQPFLHGYPVVVPAPVTAAERLGNALNELATAVGAVETAVAAVEDVRADDGSSAMDVLGAEGRLVGCSVSC